VPDLILSPSACGWNDIIYLSNQPELRLTTFAVSRSTAIGLALGRVHCGGGDDIVHVCTEKLKTRSELG